MTVTISITEEQLLTACRTFLLALVNGAQVVQGQNNRVAMPTGDFVVMTPMFGKALSTNRNHWTPGSANPGSENNQRSIEWILQLDVYGPNAADSAFIVNQLVRTEYACTAFAATGLDVQPLFATDPRQTSMINGEEQYEQRYTFELHAQYNPFVTTPLDFANALTVDLVEVDVKYPPES